VIIAYEVDLHSLFYRLSFRSLKSNLPYLFTYKQYLNLQMPNTTNSLDDGLFSPMKILLKIYRGISIELKKKIIVYYLENLVN